MGSTKCKGGSLQDVLQLNQNQLPKPQRITYTVIQCYNNEIYNNTRYTKIQDTQERNISHPRAKHAPSGFHPTWTAFTGNLTTQALKDKASDASPSGILNTCQSTPQQ